MFVKIFVLCLTAYQVSAMAGGANTAVGSYPSLVGVVFALNNQVCGGQVLNANHVLTVANCLLTAPNFVLVAAAQISIMSSTNTINFALPRIAAQALYVHPQYNPFTFANDIAVVRMAQNFNFPVVPLPLVAPTVISNRIAFDTMPCQLAAWNTGNNQQQVLNVPIVNRDTCNALATNFGRIRESMICAGVLNTGSGACVINRGGGLFCNGMLEGILSSGFSCGTVANTPGIYTQLRYFTNWINEQITRQDIPAAGSSPLERLP